MIRWIATVVGVTIGFFIVEALSATSSVVLNPGDTLIVTSPPISPPKPPLPPPVESANNTQVPPAAVIVDASGAKWTLVGGKIARNGVIDPITANVALLAYENHVVWQHAAGLWWAWVSNAWQPTPGTLVDPRPVTPPAPPPVAGSRNWMFLDSPGNDTSFWANLNSGWSSQPIDGLHVYTDVGAGATALTWAKWVPTPKAVLLTFEWGTPGSGSWPGSNDLGAAARGDYNAQWLAWLQATAANTPAPVVALRIYQEVNGNWMQWSVNQTGKTGADGTPAGAPWPAATIIKAWRNAAMQARTAFPHAVIEWNLNAGTGWPGQPGDGSGYDLYPGDDLVDVVGVDAYEEGQPFATTQSGAGVNLANLAAFAVAHNKLLAVSETASSNCDGSYITSWLNWLDSLGTRAAYFAYYEANNAANSNILNVTSGQPGACPANTLQAAVNASSAGTQPFGGKWMK